MSHMSKSAENSCNSSFYNKIINETPILHTVPQLPLLMNAFSNNPNEITVFSSKDNLLTNPVSSSHLMSIKSKSFKSSKDFNKSNKSSFLSSYNIANNKSKSSSFSRKMPIKAFTPTPPRKKTIRRSCDFIEKNPENNYFPDFYFSLNQLKMGDSPKSFKNSPSLKSFHKKKRTTKTIQRNLLIFSTNREQRKSFWPIRMETGVFSYKDPKNEKIFTNKQNLILKDMCFYEEGFLYNKKKKIEKLKGFSTRFLEIFMMKILGFFKGDCLGKTTRFSMKKWRFSWDLIWDIAILTLLGFYYIWIPIEFAFEITYFPIYLLLFTGIFFMGNSFVKARILYKEKTEFLHKYLKRKLPFDVISLVFLSIFLINSMPNFRILWGFCFLLLKFPEILENTKRIHAKITLKREIELLFTIIMLLYRIFCFANLAACLWIYIGTHYKEENHSWLTNIANSNIVDSNITISQISLYFRCLSANLANITLIGLSFTQGLISPITGLEYAFNSIITTIGVLFLWYNFQSFQRVFKRQNEEKNENLKEFERILRNYGLNYKERVSFSQELGLVLNNNKEQKLFADLMKMMSPSFQENLLKRIYWPIIKKIPVLSRNFSKKFLIKLLNKIKILTFIPNETLFQEGDVENNCLYYVINGEIECFLQWKEDEKRQIRIRSLKANEYFREFSFFSNQKERFSAKCLTFSTLLRIDLHDFIETLKDFPSDFENFISIKERINTYNNCSALYPKCDNCHMPHQTLDCPLLTYKPKPSSLYHALLCSNQHIDRRIYQRKPLKLCIHPLSALSIIQTGIQDFQMKYRDEIDHLLEEISPLSDNENSDNQINESSGTNEQSKESQYTNAKKTTLVNEEFFGSPPSIFLQTPSKKSRKSMTESIFHENEEEEELDEQKPISRKTETKTDKTLNDLELDNDEEDDEDSDEDSIEKKTSKRSITDKESARVLTMNNINNHSKKDINYQKFFSERESKMLSEKDTFHVLQNFEKMYRVNNAINTGTNQMTNQMNTLTAQQSGSIKKNVVSSIMGSYSISKSNSSSLPRGKLVKNFRGKNAFFSTNNKKPQYNEYLNLPLFAFDFDQVKEYKVFFPHNNMEKVLKKVQVDGLLRWGKFFDEGNVKKKSLRSSNIANTSFSTKKKPSLKTVQKDQIDDDDDME